MTYYVATFMQDCEVASLSKSQTCGHELKTFSVICDSFCQVVLCVWRSRLLIKGPGKLEGQMEVEMGAQSRQRPDSGVPQATRKAYLAWIWITRALDCFRGAGTTPSGFSTSMA